MSDTTTKTKRTRVSNEQILEALNDLPHAIAKAMASVAASAQPTATSEQVVANNANVVSEPGTIKVDAGYKKHMLSKAATYAVSQSEPVVAYARVNKSGETKLGYALESRYNSTIVKQPSHLGALATYTQ